MHPRSHPARPKPALHRSARPYLSPCTGSSQDHLKDKRQTDTPAQTYPNFRILLQFKRYGRKCQQFFSKCWVLWVELLGNTPVNSILISDIAFSDSFLRCCFDGNPWYTCQFSPLGSLSTSTILSQKHWKTEPPAQKMDPFIILNNHK